MQLSDLPHSPAAAPPPPPSPPPSHLKSSLMTSTWHQKANTLQVSVPSSRDEGLPQMQEKAVSSERNGVNQRWTFMVDIPISIFDFDTRVKANQFWGQFDFLSYNWPWMWWVISQTSLWLNTYTQTDTGNNTTWRPKWPQVMNIIMQEIHLYKVLKYNTQWFMETNSTHNQYFHKPDYWSRAGLM